MQVYQNRLQGTLLLLPTIVVSIAFFYWPAWKTFRLSRVRTIGGVQKIPNGWEHFTSLATSGAFHYSVAASFAFAIIVVVGSMIIGLYLSYLIYEVSTGQTVYLVAAIFTYALSFAVAANIMDVLFNPTVGLFKEFLVGVTGLVGVDFTFDYTTNPVWAWMFATGATMWKMIGYNVIFMIAALSGIPESINETARLDGVGTLRMVTRVYVPMISPTLGFLAIVNTVNAFFLPFPVIQEISGGPRNTLNIMIYDIWQTYNNSVIGLASAKSLVLFAIIGLLTALQLWLSDRFAHYGGT
ncbi:carbohydrate ABC transporter permease [Haloarcula litorea]|uniref:carbohydrate ABC transporter permease n=1 Tax=Haloarcula litorea TaxID=3032579 RepID=UPI0023E81E64|nr:sugar ABC transporter permease [Halomicroarcula sp. GDY20]